MIKEEVVIKKMELVKKEHCLESKGEKEIWKRMETSDYLISSYGRIYSLISERLVCPSVKEKDGESILYINVKWNSGITVRKYINIAVGQAFLELKHKQKYNIKYINKDSTDCFYKNLEFHKKGKVISYNNLEKNKKEDDQLNNYLDNIIEYYRIEKEESYSSLLYI